MMAALFFRHVARCRSMQLYDALILPPTNHFVSGMSPSRTLSHLRNHCRLLACSPQKPSASSLALSHILSYSASLLILAAATNSRGGGNVRVSCKILVMPPPEPVDISAVSCRDKTRNPKSNSQIEKIRGRAPIRRELVPPARLVISEIRNPKCSSHFPAVAVRPPRQAHAPLHAHRAAGHIVAVAAENKGDALGDLGRRSQATPGKLLAADFELLFGEELALARSVDPAGVKDIDANLVRDQFNRGSACHVVDRRFCHVVGHGGGDRDHGMRRADDGD